MAHDGFFDDKTILITGGTGSWGNELVKQILENNSPKEIRIYSRGEHKQVAMKRSFTNACLTFIIGDVRDKNRLQTSMRGAEYVFHLAALKHVPVCEENPWESVNTNIIGTQNVIDAAIENNVKKVIDISTDKAVDPFNLYGTCKAVGEKLMIAANLIDAETQFVCIRGGNVLGTNGSVVPLFKEQILKSNTLTITDPSMTRYMMNLSQAISLIFEATATSVGGEIFVMKMPALKITDLAEVMIASLGKDVQQKIIGMRPGEKLHEVLVSRYEAKNAIEQGGYFVILPNIPITGIAEKYGTEREDLSEFNSMNAQQLNHDDIKKMLEKEGWLASTEDIELSNLSSEEVQEYHKREGWAPR